MLAPMPIFVCFCSVNVRKQLDKSRWWQKEGKRDFHLNPEGKEGRTNEPIFRENWFQLVGTGALV